MVSVMGTFCPHKEDGSPQYDCANIYIYISPQHELYTYTRTHILQLWETKKLFILSVSPNTETEYVQPLSTLSGIIKACSCFSKFQFYVSFHRLVYFEQIHLYLRSKPPFVMLNTFNDISCGKAEAPSLLLKPLKASSHTWTPVEWTCKVGVEVLQVLPTANKAISWMLRDLGYTTLSLFTNKKQVSRR